MDILEQLSAHARKRVEQKKTQIPEEEMRRMAEARRNRKIPSFHDALAKPQMSFICECKKASPSKGLIAPEFPYLEIARSYQDAGADAISCLTEPKWFLGSDVYLKEIAEAVNIPVLRKDFTVDPYMIYQAKLMGASAVLLIAAILSDEELKSYSELADTLGLSSLFEAHDAEEVKRCLAAGARIVGVNNRNLKDFTVDITNSVRLREMVPSDIIFVSESGIEKPEDVKVLKENGTDAVLIGEMLMRCHDKSTLIRELKSI